MQLIATTVLALLGAASALPSPKVQARDGITVTFYPEANFGGEPVVVSGIASNECQTVPAGIAGNVGSVTVASGALCRLTYTADTCTGHGDAFLFPDTPVSDLHNFSDPATGEVVDAGAKLTSFLCQECSDCEA